MANGPVLDLVHDEYRARLWRQGKKKYLLRMQRRDATFVAWKTMDIPLPFGVVKAKEVARAYFELWRIREGGE